MGDTGSMAFGGALAAFAIVMGTEVLLLLIGGIYVVEALSVMIQMFSFKRWGRRVFLMAPIHHHFEMKAWSETKIMVRFWILCAILCACGFALYYRYYFQFFGPMSLCPGDGRVQAARARGRDGALGRAVEARSRRRGVEVVTADRTTETTSDLARLDGVGVLVKSPGVPGEARSSRRRESGASRSGARASSASADPRESSSGSPARKGRRPRGAARSDPRRRRRPETSGPSDERNGRARSRRPSGSSASSRASSSRTWTSFQLRIAVLLNLEPDHLDRHGSFERYRDAKLRIFENQTPDDVAVVPRGFRPCPAPVAASSSARTTTLPAEPLIPGAHNRENAAAATARPRASAWPRRRSPQLCSPSPVSPHRLELVAEINGVRWVNDSKATNAAAARRALGCVLRAAAADPRRLAQGRALRGVRAGRRAGERHDGVPDRRGGRAAVGGPRAMRRCHFCSR